ncbi:unnamed protein product [Schistosoma curassoni]|uniref:ORF6 n=1 Tax=Schistosoma curassoni TaxID=6186 RepID=A0A183JIQ2_9TREM|nr:unnamed protein product [Schistosoma curassoni]
MEVDFHHITVLISVPTTFDNFLNSLLFTSLLVFLLLVLLI